MDIYHQSPLRLAPIVIADNNFLRKEYGIWKQHSKEQQPN